MLRKDGDYVIYVLQHKFKKEGGWDHSGDGGGFSLAIYENERRTGEQVSEHLREEFMASGDVWQETGIHGSYSKIAAEEFMMAIARCNTEHSFRILKMTITQNSEESCSASFT